MKPALLVLTLLPACATSGSDRSATSPPNNAGSPKPKVTAKPAQPRAFGDQTPFTLLMKGKPWRPRKVASLHGEPQRLRSGDVIWVDGVPLRLPDKPRRLDFEVAPRKDGRIFVRLPGGAKRVVAVRLGFTYVGSKRVSLDRLAKLSRRQRAKLWGVFLDDWPKGTFARLAELDPARSCVGASESIATGKRAAKVLRPLPPKLQCLHFEENSSPTMRDLRALGALKELRYLGLRLMTPKRLDAGLLAGNRNLRALRLFIWGRLENAEALGSLVELREVSLTGLKSIAFANGWRELRRLTIARTAVIDLAPLDGLPRLRRIEANASAVARLPRSLPALRRLELLSTRVQPADAKDFAKRHPTALVLYDWTQALQALARGADRLRVRDGGTCHRRGGEKTIGELRGEAKVRAIAAGLGVVPSNMHCMCCGRPTLEFYRGAKRLAMIGVHHGGGLRWPGVWPADAGLTPLGAKTLTSLLALLGASGPQAKAKALAARARQRAGVRRMACYRKLLSAMTMRAIARAQSRKEIVLLLERSTSKPLAHAKLLLKMLGCQTPSWNLRTKLDPIVLELALPAVKPAVRHQALRAAKGGQLLEGAGRWLLGEGKYTGLSAQSARTILPRVARFGLAHGRRPNRRLTIQMLAAKHKQPWAKRLLRDFILGKIAPRAIAEADRVEPGGMVRRLPQPMLLAAGGSDPFVALFHLLVAKGPSVPALLAKLARRKLSANDRVAVKLLRYLIKNGGRWPPR